MAIRIWHQSFTVLDDIGGYREALAAHFKRVARPDTEIVLHGMRPGTYQTDYPGDDIRHAVFQYLHGLQFLAAGAAAEDEGYDAYAVSTLPDPALREIRAAVGIPVVGYGESSMLLAASMNRKFGVLVFIPELADLVAENAARYGMGNLLAGARDVGFRFRDVLRAFNDPADVVARFREAARRLIEQGAQVIIPGEAPLCVMLAREGIVEVDGVPLIDSLGAWVKRAETLVDLKRRGDAPTGSGYFGARPNPQRLRELLAFYKLRDSAAATA
jgi:Asp/Glu/hydantoin racemase